MGWKRTYEADFDAVIVGEVEASPIRGSDEVVRSVDHRTLDSPQMGERVPIDRGLEDFHDGIRADLLPRSSDRLSMIDHVHKELPRVRSRRDDVHAMRGVPLGRRKT